MLFELLLMLGSIFIIMGISIYVVVYFVYIKEMRKIHQDGLNNSFHRAKNKNNIV